SVVLSQLANMVIRASASYNTTDIDVASGGELKASNSTFTLNQLTLESGCTFNPGDLVGNTFNLPLFLPASDVQNLSGTGNNNASFQDIDIQTTTLASGQTLALNADIGTAQVATSTLRYVFPDSITIQGASTTASAATLTVAPNVSVFIQAGV